MQLREALTFDDVLLVPARSEVLPNTADTTTRLTRSLTGTRKGLLLTTRTCTS